MDRTPPRSPLRDRSNDEFAAKSLPNTTDGAKQAPRPPFRGRLPSPVACTLVAFEPGSLGLELEPVVDGEAAAARKGGSSSGRGRSRPPRRLGCRVFRVTPEGQAARHGSVHPGDALVVLDGVDVLAEPFDAITQALLQRQGLRRLIGFMGAAAVAAASGGKLNRGFADATAAVDLSHPVSAAHRRLQRRGRVERSRRAQGVSEGEGGVLSAADSGLAGDGDDDTRGGDRGTRGGDAQGNGSRNEVDQEGDGEGRGRKGGEQVSDHRSHRSCFGRHAASHSSRSACSARSHLSAALASLSSVEGGHHHAVDPQRRAAEGVVEKAAPSRRHLHTTALSATAAADENAGRGTVAGGDGGKTCDGRIDGGRGMSGDSVVSLDRGWRGEEEPSRRSRGGSFSASTGTGAGLGAGTGVGVGVSDTGPGHEGARGGGGGGRRRGGETVLASSWGSSASMGRMGMEAGAAAAAGTSYRRSARPLERSRGESLQRSLEEAMEVWLSLDLHGEEDEADSSRDEESWVERDS
eukprot:jgi/Undpi1/1577/HiC_scaffold_11.g04967.m1